MKLQVSLGDGIAALDHMKPASVDLVLSDLPSGETRARFDKKPNLLDLWRAVWRVLNPDGVVVFMASSFGFAAELKQSSPDRFKYDRIWHKSIATGFLNVKRRPLRAHEFILVFGGSTYFPERINGASPIHYARRRAHGENYGPMTAATLSRAGATDRHPTSVVEFASVGTTDKTRRHPQQKPVKLLRWLVRTYSRPGDLVVDPFAGSGSTGEAALAEGRRFIGWDLDPRFGG